MGEITISAAEYGLRIALPATLAHIEDACGIAKEHLARYGAEEGEFCLILGIREALTNAVRHGSAEDPGKTVTMGLQIHPHEVVIEVEDQGKGFAWRGASLEPPAPEATKGRGLPILKRCFDTVEFNERGNRIRLVKRLSTEGRL